MPPQTPDTDPWVPVTRTDETNKRPATPITNEPPKRKKTVSSKPSQTSESRKQGSKKPRFVQKFRNPPTPSQLAAARASRLAPPAASSSLLTPTSIRTDQVQTPPPTERSVTPQLTQPSPAPSLNGYAGQVSRDDELADLIKERKHYQDLYRECRDECDTLKADIHLQQFRQSAEEEREDEIRNLHQQLLKARNQLKRLETETRLTRDKFSRELDEKDEQLSNAVDEKLKLEITGQDLRTKIQALQAENGPFHDKLSTALAEKERLEIENRRLQTENNPSSEQLSKVRESADSEPFAQRLALISAEKCKLEGHFADLKSNLEKITAEKDQLFLENGRLKDTIFEMNNAESQLQDKFSQFKENARLEYDRLRVEVCDFKGKCAQYTSQIEELNDSQKENTLLIHSLQLAKTLLAEDIEELSQNEEKLKRELDERDQHCQKIVTDARKENTELRSQISEKEKSHMSVHQEFEQLKVEIKELKDAQEEKVRLVNSKTDKLRQVARKLDESQNRLKEEEKKTSELLSENQQIKEDHVKECDEYEMEIARLQGLADQAHSVQKERDCERGKHERLRYHYGQMVKEKTGLLSEIKEAQNQIKDMKHTGNKLTKKIEGLDAALAEKDQEVEILKDLLTTAIIDAAQQTGKAEDLASQLQTCHEGQEELEKRIDDCSQEILKQKALRLAHMDWLQASRRFGSRARFHGKYCDRWGNVYIQGWGDELRAALQEGVTVKEALDAVEKAMQDQGQGQGQVDCEVVVIDE